MTRTPDTTGERLARIETKVEHVSTSQEALSKDYAGAKRLAEVTFGEIKESILQLRIHSETLLKMLEAAHKRIDGVDEELKHISNKVDRIDEEVKDYKRRIQTIVWIGGTAVTAFWAVFGAHVQKFVGGLLGS